MLAIIKTGGKQYLVKPGDEIKIEKIKDKKEGDKIEFTEVLLLEKNRKLNLGQPFLKDIKISGRVIEVAKDKKITILKYKSKTRSKVKKGHRQPFMKVKIENF